MRWIKSSREILQEGYVRVSAASFQRFSGNNVDDGCPKYYGKPFKVATPGRWVVIVSGPTLIEEIRRLPDDVVNFTEASDEVRFLH
jgi:hypothetical protein